MRKGMWGAIAGLTAGAGTAWGQTPAADPPPPAAVAPAGELVPVQGPGPIPPGVGLPPGFGAPGGGPRSLPPTIMPPVAPGPAGDPQGFGPMAGFGPPPGPMYPPPGPYGQHMFQPAPGGAGGGGGVETAPHFWTRFEYLLWYSKSQGYPFPLLTTSAPTDGGLPSRASTIALAGGENIAVNPVSGGRVTLGFFGDADRRFGFEGSGFVTEQGVDRVTQVTSPSGIPLLARPFRDSLTPNLISTLVVASPTLGPGRAVVFNGQQTWSVEANGVVNLYRSEPGCSTGWTIDVLAGYRFLELEETLRISSTTTLNLPNVVTPVLATGPFGVVTVVGQTVTPGTLNVAGLTAPSGSTIMIVDSVRTQNQFNGVHSGIRGEVRHGMFTFGMSGKLGIGHMRQVVEIDGFTNIAAPAATVAVGNPGVSGRAVGGLYGNAATIGRFNNDEFAVIPEVSLTLGVNVTRNLNWHVGYNFLYVDQVVRPATELTTTVNSATVPLSPNYGALARPLVRPVQFNQDDFWLMGLNTGFTVRF